MYAADTNPNPRFMFWIRPAIFPFKVVDVTAAADASYEKWFL